MADQMRDKAADYLASAKAAGEAATRSQDRQIKTSLEGIARVYREMAERARRLADEDEDRAQEPPQTFRRG